MRAFKRFALTLLRAARPRHWIKNLACFLPVVFSGGLFDPLSVARGVAATLIFCLAASAVYLFNDVADAERDRAHPVKRGRPVASGDLAPFAALGSSAVLACAALAFSARLGGGFQAAVAFYLGLNAAYCAGLSERPLVDVFCIALGFCARVIAGVIAIDSRMSPWIVLATFFLMLMVGFGKRRAEFSAFSGAAPRPGRKDCSPAALDRCLMCSGGIAVATYALFAILSSPNPDLILTVPFVAYGVFRYLMLADAGAAAEVPELLAIQDAPSICNGLLWIASYVFLAGRSRSFFTR